MKWGCGGEWARDAEMTERALTACCHVSGVAIQAKPRSEAKLGGEPRGGGAGAGRDPARPWEVCLDGGMCESPSRPSLHGDLHGFS